MAKRYIPNESSELLNTAHPDQELTLSLDKLVRKYTPQTSYSQHDLRGLYSGPTSVAYLFLQVSVLYPHLSISRHKAKSWCEAYLSAERSSKITPDDCGVINEELAYCAISAASTGDEKKIDLLARHASNLAEAPGGSNEWLYGRAGLLYLLRLVRHWVPSSKEALNACVSKVCNRIIDDGPKWEWHGKQYLGAVHGSMGIITQVILSDPIHATNPKIVSALQGLLEMQDQATGNFPSSVESGKDHLVQFCHGAPGFALSLPLIREYCDPLLQHNIDRAVEKARGCIWKKGLLTKEPNLCHGTSANALALRPPQQGHFMAYTMSDIIEKGKREGWYIEGSDPYGLFCGEAGRAWAWAVFHSGKDLGIIGYSDL
ncbi:MAG: hypothetical protein Q9208_007350 [Pyrenodesmia sp. 3 TL-2023]